MSRSTPISLRHVAPCRVRCCRERADLALSRSTVHHTPRTRAQQCMHVLSFPMSVCIHWYSARLYHPCIDCACCCRVVHEFLLMHVPMRHNDLFVPAMNKWVAESASSRRSRSRRRYPGRHQHKSWHQWAAVHQADRQFASVLLPGSAGLHAHGDRWYFAGIGTDKSSHDGMPSWAKGFLGSIHLTRCEHSSAVAARSSRR